ncbi:MAG: STAS domain-containing protein [Candidatus Dadabacteria bacterium]|nr:STAS domain-containing protein [Candidatus Dadabacteria bacterium]MYA47735.1 STAS domain-containing protein [Candidatus Dadabacteria bacterium]MYF47803.1 STAS domain-containing protein [Candidatus Dadabacteria bacterium]MYG83215.1 STAS domain-containing protein [Candidatus Dadabacteria bacterium]MYK50097.1 STAS domain-containing protein [Candidatus Dadabacteria bacterium]
MSDAEFKIQVDQSKGVLMIAVSGEIKGLSGREFHRAIFEEIQEQDVPIVLDLEGLTYINSMGLRSILLIAKRQQENKAKFAVCSLSKPMREVFEITCFDRIMPVLDSRSEAIATVT